MTRLYHSFSQQTSDWLFFFPCLFSFLRYIYLVLAIGYENELGVSLGMGVTARGMAWHGGMLFLL